MHGERMYDSCGFFSVKFYGTSSRSRPASVSARVGDPIEMPELLGLLLVLLQDRLPRLLQEQGQQSGERAPSLSVHMECTLSFGSGCSMWAPLAKAWPLC